MATKQENAGEYEELAELQYRGGGWRSRGGFRRGGGGGVGSPGEDETSVGEHGSSTLVTCTSSEDVKGVGAGLETGAGCAGAGSKTGVRCVGAGA